MSEHNKSHIHILPLKTYLSVGAALLVLTAVTVGVSFIPLGGFNVVVALLIASVKALLVALFFMHLLYDKKIFMIIFAVAILFLALFITFTMFDTMRRGDIDVMQAAPIEKDAVIYKESGSDSSAASSGLVPDSVTASQGGH